MGLFSRLISQAAREFAENPESREKAKETFQNDVKPELEKAKGGLLRFARKVGDEYRKGRDGED